MSNGFIVFLYVLGGWIGFSIVAAALLSQGRSKGRRKVKAGRLRASDERMWERELCKSRHPAGKRR